MTTDTKPPASTNPLGIDYRPPQQKIVRLNTAQRAWLEIKEKPLYYLAIGLVLSLSVTVAATKFLVSPGAETVAIQEELPIDKQSILSASETDLQAVRNQSVAQLENYRESLLQARSERFLIEAQKQVGDKTNPCFMQSYTCALDLFQAEAVSRLEQARSDGDHDGLLRAADRALIVEYARSSKAFNSEPEHALTQVAIDNLVQAYSRHEAATAEAQASELQSNRSLQTP